MRFSLALIMPFLLIASFGCLSNEKQAAAIGNGTVIQIEVVKTPEERARGLMFREGLEENDGMLFVFEEEGYPSFWMKNVRFPLDILWLDGDLMVVHISANTPPCRAEPCEIYTSPKPAKYVLELKANFTLKNDVKIGDKLFLDKR